MSPRTSPNACVWNEGGEIVDKACKCKGLARLRRPRGTAKLQLGVEDFECAAF
jgi:hypothetical protein